MQWLDLCSNPGAVSAYYSSAPSLERFEVVEAVLMRYSPSIHLSGVVPVRPDKYVAQGEGQQPDGVTLTLAFWHLSDLSVEGLPQGEAGSLCVVPGDENRITFDFRSPGMTCRGIAKSVVVEGISPRTTSPATVRGPKLFSYRNVWNSCLLLARSKGFSLQLVGHPDERESTSWCRWRATKEDGTELTADNPIELAGLIALYEHHRPAQGQDYWWRIDGPDVLTELQEQWSARYFGSPGQVSEAAT
jgi:hypothetical protein